MAELAPYEKETLKEIEALAKQTMSIPPTESSAYEAANRMELLKGIIESFRERLNVPEREVPFAHSPTALESEPPHRPLRGGFQPPMEGQKPNIRIEWPKGSGEGYEQAAYAFGHEALHAAERKAGIKKPSPEYHFAGGEPSKGGDEMLEKADAYFRKVVQSLKKKTDEPYAERLEQLTGLRDTAEAERLLWPKVKK